MNTRQELEDLIRNYQTADCGNEELKQKYMTVSNMLFELFMTEHNNIGSMFKEQ